MNKLLKSGKIWPYAIGISIIAVFGACVATVIVAGTLPVEKSDTYMMGYHQADANANELITARINFDKKYKIEYITDSLDLDNSVLKYKVTNLSGDSVNNAVVNVVVTRPNNHKHDLELVNPSISDGEYTFSNISLPVAGRWDIMAKVQVGELQRFYNVKADTRSKEVIQY